MKCRYFNRCKALTDFDEDCRSFFAYKCCTAYPEFVKEISEKNKERLEESLEKESYSVGV